MAGRVGRALRHRNYRLFFAGQGISVIGTWLTRFAIAWMAYRLTGSPLILGLVGFFSQAPTSVIAPFAGVLVDRWDRHRTIIVTQVAAMLQSTALAVFALTGTMTVWHLLVLGAVQGVINGFDMPARQSFLGQMIDDRADLPNAIALNSSMVNCARLIGPVVAAVLVDLWGEGVCFAIDAASYVAVIASLLMMRVVKRPRRSATATCSPSSPRGCTTCGACRWSAPCCCCSRRRACSPARTARCCRWSPPRRCAAARTRSAS